MLEDNMEEFIYISYPDMAQAVRWTRTAYVDYKQQLWEAGITPVFQELTLKEAKASGKEIIK
jgi:hypothetical protein